MLPPERADPRRSASRSTRISSLVQFTSATSRFFTGDWKNCARSLYIRYVFGVRAPDRCEGLGYHEDGHFRLRKRNGYEDSVGEQVGCPGVYRVTAKAYHDGELIGRQSRWVRVLP